MDLPLHLDHIRAAEARIAPFINATPILSSAFFSNRASAAACAARSPGTAVAPCINLLLKAESLQKTGSFKIRGATNAVRIPSARTYKICNVLCRCAHWSNRGK
jgi:threonine dehydratase